MSDVLDVLDGWLAEAGAALGVATLTAAERDAVLDLAREVAHGVARPAAPLTAFLLGLAVGRGANLESARAELTRLANRQLHDQE